MAFVTGTASSQVDLLNALKSACTANGWTLTGTVLHKGEINVRVYNDGTAGWNNCLVAWMGKGKVADGSALTDAFQYGMAPNKATRLLPSAYPVTYDIHVLTNPDEVFMTWWDATGRHFWIAFGQSSPYSSTPGTGCNLWIGATSHTVFPVTGGTNSHPIVMSATTGGTSTGVSLDAQMCVAPALFWHTHNPVLRSGPSCLYTDSVGGVNGSRGNISDTTDDFEVSGIRHLNPLLSRQPNAWNQESILLPIQCMTPVASAKRKMDIQVGHARYFRLTNVDPGTIITISGEQWKVYPWYLLNRSAPNSANTTAQISAVDHTGTFGWAIRYTGP